MNGDGTQELELATKVEKQPQKSFQDLLDIHDRQMDLAYEQELKIPEVGKDARSIIGWKGMQDAITDNVRVLRMAQIITKYDEYGQRLARNLAGTIPPTHDLNVDLDSLYKRELAKQIILKGEVNTAALRTAIQKTGGHFDSYLYLNACTVIKGYTENGGQRIIGGTGLRQPSNKV